MSSVLRCRVGSHAAALAALAMAFSLVGCTPVSTTWPTPTSASPTSAILWQINGDDSSGTKPGIAAMAADGEVLGFQTREVSFVTEFAVGEKTSVAFSSGDPLTIIGRDGTTKRVQLDAGVTSALWWPERGSFLVTGNVPSDEHGYQNRLVEMSPDGTVRRELMVQGFVESMSMAGNTLVVATSGVSAPLQGHVEVIDLAGWKRLRSWTWEDGPLEGCLVRKEKAHCVRTRVGPDGSAAADGPEDGFALNLQTGERGPMASLPDQFREFVTSGQRIVAYGGRSAWDCDVAWACRKIADSPANIYGSWWQGEDLVLVATEIAGELPADQISQGSLAIYRPSAEKIVARASLRTPKEAVSQGVVVPGAEPLPVPR